MITDEQRRERRAFIGSSDAAAICGVDPWRTASDVFLEKKGRVRPQKPGPALVVGRYCETGLLDWVQDSLTVAVSRDIAYVHPNGIMAANLDGLILDPDLRAIVEAKTAGLMAGRWVDAFGEPETDQVPDHVLIQATHQLAVVNAQPELDDVELVLVPALLVHRGFVLFRLRRNAALMAAVTEACERFTRDYLEPDVLPPEMPTLATLEALHRTEDTVPIADPIVAAWLEAKEVARVAGKAEDESRRILLAALGAAEAGACAAGVVSYREQTRKSYTVAETAFRRLHFQPATEAAAPRRRRA